MTIARVPASRSQSSADEVCTPLRREPSTGRRWWIIAYLLTAVAVLIRAPGLYDDVQQRLDGAGIAEELTDESMRVLALKIGFYIALLLSLIILVLYYSLAAALERHVFKPSISLFGGKVEVGLLFLVALLSTLPVHVFSALFGVTAPKSEPVFPG